MIGPVDRLERPLGALRLSVTDRCNLRCRYCMPEDEYRWLPRESVLTFDELARLAAVFSGLGVHKIRLTGGEPLMRPHLEQLVAMIRERASVSDIALTTNGVLLAPAAARLKAAGLDRATISLDTLRPERMKAFARGDRHADVIAGIDAAIAAGMHDVKLNTVVVRGFNEDEIADLARFAFDRGIEPRFIEYMDVGGATRWNPDDVVARDEILAALARDFGALAPMHRVHDAHAPAELYRFGSGQVIGVIASTTAPFCRACDRARITADGMLLLCLYAEQGVDLRAPLRDGATDLQLRDVVSRAWSARADRGAETRANLAGRGVLVALEDLRADPRREMHVRGG